MSQYSRVKHGTLKKTSGGLGSGDIVWSPTAKKYVSRKRRAHGQRMYRENNLAAYQAPAFGPAGGVRKRRASKKKKTAAKPKTPWW